MVLSPLGGEISCTVETSSGWSINIQHLVKPIRHVRLRCYIYYPYCTIFVPSTVSAAACLLYTYTNLHFSGPPGFVGTTRTLKNQNAQDATGQFFLGKLHIQMYITERHSPREHWSNSNKKFSEYQTCGRYSFYLGFVSMPYFSFEVMTPSQ